jgi:hypothetical protein
MTAHAVLIPARRSARKLLLLGAALALAVGGVAAVAVVATTQTASAANISLNQCNGVNGGGGQTTSCHVVIINTLTDSPLTTGSVVTINGGAPTASADLVTSVTQCNGSARGGGGWVNCSVDITNNIAANVSGSTGAATINQCNGTQAIDGLGNAPTTCSPYPASTSGATITQCNSGTGDGGGLVPSSHCTASGVVGSALPVTINQCIGSADGGDATVNCSATISTNIIDSGLGSPTPDTGGTGGTGGTSGGGGTGGTTRSGVNLTGVTPGLDRALQAIEANANLAG